MIAPGTKGVGDRVVLDASAIVALLQREPEAPRLVAALAQVDGCVLSAATRVETGILMLARRGEAAVVGLDVLLRRLEAAVVPVTAEQAELALDAFRRFGKGRHPAALDFGDCFAYALARALDLPLLFKGDDFAATDVRVAVY